jgi:hypothetical protein
MKNSTYATLIGIMLVFVAFGGGFVVGKKSVRSDTTSTPTPPLVIQPDSVHWIEDDLTYQKMLDDRNSTISNLLASGVTLAEKLAATRAENGILLGELKRISKNASTAYQVSIITENKETLTTGTLKVTFSPPLKEFGYDLRWNPIKLPDTQRITSELYDPSWVKPMVAFTSSGAVIAFYEKKPLIGVGLIAVTALLSYIKL